MSYEYRVLWRREHDKTLRRRLYQTQRGAEDFARLIETPITDDYLEAYTFQLLSQLGEVTDLRIERRQVSEWGEE